MILYFVNGSKQKKLLMESDYADDLYDVMIGFFEEHGRYPHFLELVEYGGTCEIHFESKSEFFLLTEMDGELVLEWKALLDEFN